MNYNICFKLRSVNWKLYILCTSMTFQRIIKYLIFSRSNTDLVQLRDELSCCYNCGVLSDPFRDRGYDSKSETFI